MTKTTQNQMMMAPNFHQNRDFNDPPPLICLDDDDD